ncbi:Bd3614 family nucleic acid deaminase [Archangium minus]
MAIASALIIARHAQESQGNPLYRGANIGSVLVNAQGKIIAWGVNTNSDNSTLHAEVNCVQMYQKNTDGAPIPRGSRLYTTLQSCEMCSAMLTTTCETDLTVIYGERDFTLRRTTLMRGANGCTERRCNTPIRAQASVRWAGLAAAIRPAAGAFGHQVVRDALQPNDDRQRATQQFVRAQTTANQQVVDRLVQAGRIERREIGTSKQRGARYAQLLGRLRGGAIEQIRTSASEAYRQAVPTRVTESLGQPAALRAFAMPILRRGEEFITEALRALWGSAPNIWTPGDKAAFAQGVALVSRVFEDD